MEQIIIKVYGSITPANQAMLNAVQNIAEGSISLDGDVLLISHEGMYFMIDECIDALKPLMDKDCEGRIDYIDMDEWTLSRYWIHGGLVTHSTVGLNQVMAYSGH